MIKHIMLPSFLLRMIVFWHFLFKAALLSFMYVSYLSPLLVKSGCASSTFLNDCLCCLPCFMRVDFLGFSCLSLYLKQDMRNICKDISFYRQLYDLTTSHQSRFCGTPSRTLIFTATTINWICLSFQLMMYFFSTFVHIISVIFS